MKSPIVFTCEHAVNTVPKAYQYLFETEPTLLNTHRAIDFGALNAAKTLSKALHAPFIQAQTTRLLIDCNRSLSNSGCFSEITKPLSNAVRQTIIDAYYTPYRQAVLHQLEKTIAAHGSVIHLSMHSFTPIMHGQIRQADLGFLYDPRRAGEKQFVQTLMHSMKQEAPHLRIRRNYPYKGISDGFTTALRKQWSESQYVGIEIEYNQGIIEQFDTISAFLIKALASL